MKFKIRKKNKENNEIIESNNKKKNKRAVHIFYKIPVFIKNLKIAPKILTGFFIIAILGAGMGIYDSTVLNQVNASGNHMYKEMLLPLRSINELSNEFEQERMYIRNMLFTDDATMNSIFNSQIGQTKQNIDSTFNTLKMLISKDSDATTALNDLQAIFANYDKLMAAGLQNILSGNKAAVIDDFRHTGDLYNAEKAVAEGISKLESAALSKAATLDTSNRKIAAAVQLNTYILIGAVVGLSLLIGITTARNISKPVKKLTFALKKLADGDTGVPPSDYDSRDEVGQMMNAYENILSAIKSLEEDTDTLILAAAEGQLTIRADSEKHQGAYKKIIEGFNQTLDAVTMPVNEAAEVLEEVSKGNLNRRVEGDFKGDHAIIKNSLNRTIATLKELATDIDILIEAAVEGRLGVRADSEKHQGVYRQMIEGINTTLDAVIQPIKEAVQILQEVSRGNLEVSITQDFKGDHAIIKNALNDTIATLKRYIGEISSTLGEIADGNLSGGITSEYQGNFTELKNSINKIVDSLSDMLAEINVASEQMAVGTRQLSDGSQAISVGATQQASSIEELTASIAQISEQTAQNAANSNESKKMSLAVKQAAEQCSGQMNEMLGSMETINESSRNISKIIKVIDDIAFQTNILALNAAVEAARAGVHGKGFAVVAEEVRNLAARSANAAKETTDLIEGSIKKVAAGSNIADETAKALSDIVKDVDKAVELGEKIASASADQASGIAQINRGIEQVSLVVQNNSATAQQGAAASQELYGQAELLKKKIEVFKLKQSVEICEEDPQPKKPDVKNGKTRKDDMKY